MANSEKPSSAKCFSGLMRRLLCSGSLPTHPSDDMFIERKSKDIDHPEGVSKPNVQAPSTPGIVARLMGLDSLPNINLSPKQTTFGSFLRSRSANSLDYLPAPFDLNKKLQHRRVKTSISFREVSGSVHQDGHEHFVVVRFEKVLNEEKEEKGLRMRKLPEVRSCRQVNQKRVVQSKVYDNNGEKFMVKKSSKRVKDSKRVHPRSSLKVENVTSQRKNNSKRARPGLKERRLMKPVDSKEASAQVGFKKLGKNKYLGNKLRLDCHTENTSPALDLCLLHSQSHQKVTKPGNSRPTNPKNCPQGFTNIEGSLCNNKRKSAIASNFEEPMKTLETDYYTKMLTDICRLSEDDIKGTSWVDCQVLSFEDLEEICVHFGQQIFELLLNQVVDELLI